MARILETKAQLTMIITFSRQLIKKPIQPMSLISTELWESLTNLIIRENVMKRHLLMLLLLQECSIILKLGNVDYSLKNKIKMF